MSTQRQIGFFILAGVAATGTDATVYALALQTPLPGTIAAAVGLEDHDIAKSMSFVVGTFVSYGMNKRLTFGSQSKDPRELASFLALYGTTFLLNVAVNHSVIAALGEAAWVAPLAFLVATGFSTVANFFGTRFWVFKPPS